MLFDDNCCDIKDKYFIVPKGGKGQSLVDRLVEALFLNYFLSRSSSCCQRFLELIPIVLILETLDLCLFFLNFKEAVNQR